MKNWTLSMVFIVVFVSLGESADTLSLGNRDYLIENDIVYSFSSSTVGCRMFQYTLIVRKQDKSAPSSTDFVHMQLSGISIRNDMLLDDYYILDIDSNQDPINAAATIFSDSEYEYVEFDAVAEYSTSSPDDTYWDDQWNLHSDRLQLEDAWDINTGVSTVIVGTMDTGINYKHPDLIGNIWQNLGEDDDDDGHVLEFINGEWQLDPGDLTSPDDSDDNGKMDDLIGWNFKTQSNDPSPGTTGLKLYHGTAVAGILAARTNNGIGVGGIAGGWNLNQGISILVTRNNENDPSSSEILLTSVGQGISYAIGQGVKVITLSLSYDQEIPFQWLEDIIDSVVEIEDCVVIAASGNTGGPTSNNTDIFFPAANENVIAVGAVDPDDDRWFVDQSVQGSCFGSNLSVVAPGGKGSVGIITTDYAWPSGSGYRSLSKTSAAAPQVAGIAVLIRSIRPDLSAVEVREVIELSAEKVNGMQEQDFHVEYGYGRVNAYRALLCAKYDIVSCVSGSISGTISENTLLYEEVSVPSNLTVNSGVNLVIESGTTLEFPDLPSDYVYFDVYGNLIADGTEDNPIRFTSSDPAPAAKDWYGIRIFSSSDDEVTIMDHCIIEYGYYGLYINATSPTITNSTIQYNDFGLYTRSNSPAINTNTIANNRYGVYSNLASPKLHDNLVEDNTYRGLYFMGTSTPEMYSNTVQNTSGIGVYMYDHADVQFGHSGANDPGYNEIMGNQVYGVYAYYYSDPFLGTTDPYNQQVAGSNSVYGNNDIHLGVANHSTADAQWNHWGNSTDFYSDATSSMNVSQALQDPPSESVLGSSLAKGSEYEGYADCADYDFFDPDTSSECALWYWAHDLRVTEQLPVALWAWELYVSKFPSAENAPKALVKIANFTPEEDRQDLIGYLGGVMETSAYSDILRVKALELLIGINIKTGAFADAYTCALALLDQSLCEDQEKIALFSLIDLSQIEGLGKSSLAAGYLGRLKATYPNDELTLMAAEIMGEEVDWSQMRAGTPEPQEEVVALPAKFELYQAYPNPFNPITTIRYDLPEDVQVQLNIFDITGREVTTLVSQDQATGVYDVQWNGLGSSGISLPSGLYIYRLQAGEFTANAKMLLLK